MCCAGGATRVRLWWKARFIRGFFVISAPYSGGQVSAGALHSFLRQAGGVFDDIVLDTAAGMGAPFEAARTAADLALICITPDPWPSATGVLCAMLCWRAAARR